LSLQIASLIAWGVLLAAAAVLEGVFASALPPGRRSSAAIVMDRAMMAASGLAIFETFIAQFFSELRATLPWMVVGAALAIVGLTLRTIAMRTLGRRFVLTPMAQPGTGLVTKGVYSVVRHPGYAGLYLYFLGLGFLLSPFAAVLAEIPILVLGQLRIIGEEKILAREFGGEFDGYKTAVHWRVVPWLW
jgi:protein-S-isoprenylcysteine O-methyltransferase Ste14